MKRKSNKNSHVSATAIRKTKSQSMRERETEKFKETVRGSFQGGDVIRKGGAR